MTKRIYNIMAVFILLIVISATSCRKEETISSDPNYKLQFSTDSVMFDTVFTTMGSVTKRLMVYNPNPNALIISRVSLAGGSNSPYTVNIDGASGSVVRNIEIAGKDSMYVFVRVTIDPLNENMPLVVKDSVIFETNGNYQDIDLLAWGQDAHFILPKPEDQIEGFPQLSYIAHEGEDIHWTNDKPYVVVGYGVVDSAASLTIDAGCRIHFYNGAGLWIYRYANIQVNGTLEEPVTFQGVRLEQEYAQVPSLTTGGRYNFKNSTFANYWSYEVRKDPLLHLSDYYIYFNGEEEIIYTGNVEEAYFGDCIFYGNLSDEVFLDKFPEGGTDFYYHFDYSLLKTSPKEDEFFTNCIFNEDPKFIDYSALDFHLDTLSPAIKKGIPMGNAFDLDGILRSQTPDLGAYEWVPEEE
ncbi:MAG: hypothetical protein B7C24_16190 [Bacteroidetes bacterium 4572_77]|nr:MAG: hypothetical protein B7C24_16190 [Bacteroidetes bacterium 4572_77]